jgi:beta-lactam-binding protein with PASTA domain
MWQQYKKNEKLSEGQTVDIKISKGPEDKTSTVSITVDFSNAPADTFYFTVTLVLKDGSEKNIIDYEQRPKAAGSEIVNITGTGSGAKVIVYFDETPVKTYAVDFNTETVSG